MTVACTVVYVWCTCSVAIFWNVITVTVSVMPDQNICAEVELPADLVYLEEE